MNISSIDEVKNIIRTFIINELTDRPIEALTDDYDIVKSGFLDWSETLYVIEGLEKIFGIEIGDEEVTYINFYSINHLAEFCMRKYSKSRNMAHEKVPSGRRSARDRSFRILNSYIISYRGTSYLFNPLGD